MIIYLDNEYKCHLTNDGTMMEVETDVFNGKCNEFIEGYRFVPSGHTWVRKDGVSFSGEMITPWKDYNELAQSQKLYDMINTPNEINPSRIDELEAQVTYISMMTDLMEV